MPSLRGSLVRVTASPSTAVGVLVRAPEVRAGRGGLVLTEETQIAVDRGEFTVELEPGPAVLTVQHAGYPGEVIPLMVTEGQTNIAEAMKYAAIADSAEKSEIEELLAAVKAQASAAHDAATTAEDHRVKAYKFTEVTKQYRDQAEAAKDTATTKADEAAESKRRAWQFFSSAQNFSDKAAEFKDQAEAAKDRAVSAKNSAETAKARAESARTRAEQAKTGAESAKSGAEAAKNAAEAAKNAAQASGKPSGGWLKSDFEQAVQSSLTDVENATHQGQASMGRNALARFSGDGQLYVGKAKYGVSAARKDYVDDAVQGLAAQLNAAKDELSAGIAAATCITGLACTPAGSNAQLNLQTAGTATDVIAQKNNNPYSPFIVFEKACVVLRIVLKQENYTPNNYDLTATAMERVSKGTEVNLDKMHRGLFIIWLIIGQPQD